VTVKKLLLIVHGVKASTTRGRREVELVERACRDRGVAVETRRTTRAGHCAEIVREADLSDVDGVGVVGGDGTLREAVEGWTRRVKGTGEKTPVFAFPCGTGNNFCRDVGARTAEETMEKVCGGRVRDVDAVRVRDGNGNETVSINVVTWGMARDAAETAEGMRWLGPARYDVAGLWHILKNKRNEATIGVSDALEGSFEEEHKDYLMMFAQNTRCSGRAFAFTPLAQLDDGMFDVVVCDKGSAFHTKSLFDATKTGGGHVEDAKVSYVKAKRLSLKTKEAESVGIDGEVTVPTPVELTAMEGSWCTFV
tara:strand:- start:1522 stop:2448 length:927 start_codon:yes stop_codon:yes gene_type:complete